MSIEILLLLALFSVGFLYASVGHGGASGYLAVLSIFAIPLAQYKTMVLLLNILVAGAGFIQFYRAGFFRWHLCWPFLLTSIPFAFLGSKFALDTQIYHTLLGIALVFPVIRLLGFGSRETLIKKDIPLVKALIWGALLGLLAGILNIGGGIFLSPLLMLMGWANSKESASVSTLFIVCNSLAGLLGYPNALEIQDSSVWFWFFSALAGGFAGAYFGSRYFKISTVRYLLTVVLAIASFKLLFLM
ncbi:sulfite exporter TauE/SafE family protein [Pedobacter glucosidilyticus]|uniref:sulfite exporter TauE/SafE family protein n=1 Tax=Pedobacter glucosidilyticus TaxID=1122941 RepID=UPI0026F1BB93|nr:sulfite exporter TauE/SafE family protein [Pedobacter glucosidilyticus]